jgi:succinyl-diaminopimelate desuccinylase
MVISDGNQFGPGVPAITCGLRGLLSYELRIDGPNRDLHSGSFGGCVANPANALADVLASMRNGHEEILLPGFYDDVLPLSDLERCELAALPFDEKLFLEGLGVDASCGEDGFSLLERRWGRPTFDVCGLWGGHCQEARRNIVPAAAGAHFSFRLAPQQEPQKIASVLRQWVTERMPRGLRWELIERQRSPSVLVSRESPWVSAAIGAITDVFGRPPALIREGASIPIVATLQQRLNADPLLIGWGQNTDNTHGPNERFSLDDYHRAAVTHCHLWRRLAELSTRAIDRR